MDSISRPITVLPLPVANFQLESTLCEENEITFKNSSNTDAGVLEKWTWNFGDNTTTVIQTAASNIKHTYTSTGTYTSTLTVTGDNGCTSIAKEVLVKVNPLPQLAFTLPKVCLPEAKAVFENKSSITDGTPISYLWDFDDPLDKSSGATPNGTHTYRAMGVYKVKLIGTSINNCRDSLIQRFEDVFAAPKAAFSSQDSACLGEKIDFVDQSQVENGILTNWYWDLGDRSTVSEESFTHRYSDPGRYTVSLYAKTSIGCLSDTAMKTIEVFSLPTISAGPDLSVLDDGQKQMLSTATGNNMVFRWFPALYLDDSTKLSPLIIKPQEDQVYTLEAVGRGNCRTVDEVKITVLKLPKPPNTFTPNGDGINDTWEIPYLDQYTESILEVYTTQGQLVYRSVGYAKRWDGTFNGKPLPAGTYYYVLDPRNGRKKISSYVTIFR